MAARSYDVAVIGAGVFGAWTAYWLRKSGRTVALVDAYGAGNSRASSGGETRIIRIGYGADELYSRWALRALGIWQNFAEETGEAIFHKTGMLWLATERDEYTRHSFDTVKKIGGKIQRVSPDDLAKKWPQIAVDDVAWAAYEPNSGVLMARRAVAAVVTAAQARGVIYSCAEVDANKLSGKVSSVALRDGGTIRAGAFVFCCGPWLPKIFPELLGKKMFISRQEVFFSGVPPGATEFCSPALPTWLHHDDQFYGMPDIESRGLKLACDRHGAGFDPSTGSRIPSAKGADEARAYVARRFPRMKDAPIVEARVCQYENTSSGDFLIDRHPDCENVWIAGGGSGHGFKHGPVVGEYCAGLIADSVTPEPRFSLAEKRAAQERKVY